MEQFFDAMEIIQSRSFRESSTPESACDRVETVIGSCFPLVNIKTKSYLSRRWNGNSEGALKRRSTMAQYKLTVNGKRQTVDVQPDTPLLWVIRDTLGLTGTKYGCGIGVCGSCTVHMDGEATRSCATPIQSCEGKAITTIEGHCNLDCRGAP